MRYDEFDEYSSRSSRGSTRNSDRRSSGGRDYGSRDYDRGYSSRDYDRSYSSYDRDYDRGYSSYDRDYDRGYSRDYRSSDRYSTRNQGYYDDFDQLDWERTAPNWDDRSGARRKPSGGGSRGSSGRSSSHHSGGSRGGSDRRPAYDSRSRSTSGSRSGSGRKGSSSGRRPSDSRRGSTQKRKKNIQLVPIVLGLVLIILAALIVKSFIGGSSSDYEIELDSQTIVVGESATASITGLSETEEYEITWGSSDPNVISMDGSGKTCTLSAKKEGSVTIAADINGETIQKTVMVVDVAPGVVNIKVGQETVEIKSGESYTVQATVEMESDNMKPAKITWSSSDPSVAMVDKNGVITGRDVGSAIIKATAGEKTAEIVVTVVENPDNNNHDESQSTGNEPEEGSVQPDPGDTGTTGNTGGTGGSTGGGTEGTNGGETEGGDTGDLGSDITGQSPAEGTD